MCTNCVCWYIKICTFSKKLYILNVQKCVWKFCVHWMCNIVYPKYTKLCTLNIRYIVYFLKNCVYNSIYSIVYIFWKICELNVQNFEHSIKKNCVKLCILNCKHSIIDCVNWTYKIVYNVQCTYIHVKYHLCFILPQKFNNVLC